MTIEYTIDAFLDGETVAPSALDAALAAAEGRAYLIDALAIRQLVSDAPAAVMPARRRPVRWFSARAAILALGLVGLGYAAGARNATPHHVVIPTKQAAIARCSVGPRCGRLWSSTSGECMACAADRHTVG